jgi:AcrR family transcriptional regulator
VTRYVSLGPLTSPDVALGGRPERVPSTIVGGGPAQERTLRAQGRRTLRRLLDGGLEVLDKRGYHAARVDDICAAAHTSHGTFYLYFSSKEDLFRALLNDVSDEMVTLAGALPAIAPTPQGYDALYAWLSSFYDVYLHYHPVIRAWMETEVASLDLEGIATSVLGGFSSALAERIAEASPATFADGTAAALAAVAMVERFSYFSVMGVLPLEREEVLGTLATILHVGLFGGKPRPAR